MSDHRPPPPENRIADALESMAETLKEILGILEQMNHRELETNSGIEGRPHDR